MSSFKTVLMILRIKFCVLAQGNYRRVYYYGCAFVYFIFQILKYWNKVWSSFKSCSWISKVWDSENLWQWSHFETRLAWIGSFRWSTILRKRKSHQHHHYHHHHHHQIIFGNVMQDIMFSYKKLDRMKLHQF